MDHNVYRTRHTRNALPDPVKVSSAPSPVVAVASLLFKGSVLTAKSGHNHPKKIPSIIAPLLFSTLVVGIAGHGDRKSLGKIGLKTTVYIPNTHYNGKNLWLIKAMNLNRGLAIKIIDSIESCENTIRYFYQGGIYKSLLYSEKMKD